MPFELNEDLIEEALGKEEIQSGAERAGLTNNFLRARVMDKESNILEAAVSKIEAYNELQSEYKRVRQQIMDLKYALETSWVKRVVKWLAILAVALPVLSLVVDLFLALYFQRSLMASIVLRQYGLLLAVYGLFAIAVVGAYVRLRARHAAKLRAARATVELDKYPNTIALANQAAREAIIEKGILPELRAAINAYLTPSYSIELTLESAPGLAEVLNPEYEVTTEAEQKLHRLLDNMPGGSIGIAGPRGAGKTTLLWSYCRPSINQLKGRPVLSIMAPAPVEYDAREFSLHVFASLCQRLLQLKDEPIRPPFYYMDEEIEDFSTRHPPTALFSRLVGFREALASLLIGSTLLVLSFYIADVVTPTNTTATREPTTSASAREPAAPSAAGRYVKSLGIKPTPIFYMGVFFTVLGFVGGLFHATERSRERAVLRHYEREAIESRPITAQARVWLHRIRFQQSYSSGWAGSLRLPIAPAAVETRRDAAMSLAQNQLSLPEIIDGYRRFLNVASTEYEIVIGIDELDKLGSDDTAQRFLNEIKALFGLERCFYLVSVSENAMSNFERRGLPFRDAFDSSFDAIVYVDYLNLDRAQHLLRRRVIDLPVPFLDLCHCISAGLPRDLIRTCRALFELRQTTPDGNNLSELCDSLIMSDLKSKLRAVSVAATDITTGPKVDWLLERIRVLESVIDSNVALPSRSTQLLVSCQVLLSDVDQESTAAKPAAWASTALTQLLQSIRGQVELNGDTAKCEEIASLRTELAVYLYYSVTLLQFFAEDLNIGALQEAEASGSLDRLTTARRFLSSSPRIAHSIITEFRRSYDMAVS